MNCHDKNYITILLLNISTLYAHGTCRRILYSYQYYYFDKTMKKVGILRRLTISPRAEVP